MRHLSSVDTGAKCGLQISATTCQFISHLCRIQLAVKAGAIIKQHQVGTNHPKLDTLTAQQITIHNLSPNSNQFCIIMMKGGIPLSPHLTQYYSWGL